MNPRLRRSFGPVIGVSVRQQGHNLLREGLTTDHECVRAFPTKRETNLTGRLHFGYNPKAVDNE
jgi:hypothetical protein